MRLLLTLSALFVLAGMAEALDTIKTTTGAASGEIITISPYKVELRQGSNSPTKEIPVNQITCILFDGEPYFLKTAKNLIALERRYEEGLAAMEKVKTSELGDRRELRQEVEFYTALAKARLALQGSDVLADAGKLMLDFVRNNDTSFHYLEACEILGDLLVANHSYALAEQYYGKLARSPWPDYRIKALVAIGWVQLAQDKTGEAMKSFEEALNLPGGTGPLVQAQRHAAQVGKAAVLVALKKPEEAVSLLTDLLRKADPGDGKLLARAHNTLGTAYRRLGKPKEALLEFLQTHLMYPTGSSDAHAEALYNLIDLWEQDHHPERAVEARKLLLEQYKNTPWAEKAKEKMKRED
jgi:tetratricopeptide (TPR) repeat protein